MRDLFQDASMFKDVLAAAVEANAEPVKKSLEDRVRQLEAEIKALWMGEMLRRDHALRSSPPRQLQPVVRAKVSWSGSPGVGIWSIDDSVGEWHGC